MVVCKIAKTYAAISRTCFTVGAAIGVLLKTCMVFFISGLTVVSMSASSEWISTYTEVDRTYTYDILLMNDGNLHEYRQGWVNGSVWFCRNTYSIEGIVSDTRRFSLEIDGFQGGMIAIHPSGQQVIVTTKVESGVDSEGHLDFWSMDMNGASRSILQVTIEAGRTVAWPFFRFHNNGDYTVVFETERRYESGLVDKDFRVICATSEGEIKWQSEINFVESGRVLDVCVRRDGSSAIVGYTKAYASASPRKPLFTLLSANGANLSPANIFSSSVEGSISSVREATSGDLLLFGYSSTEIVSGLYMASFSNSRGIKWEHTIQNEGSAQEIHQLANGDYLFISAPFTMHKVSAAGHPLWSRRVEIPFATWLMGAYFKCVEVSPNHIRVCGQLAMAWEEDWIERALASRFDFVANLEVSNDSNFPLDRVLCVPHIETLHGWQTWIVIDNPTDETAVVTLNPYQKGVALESISHLVSAGETFYFQVDQGDCGELHVSSGEVQARLSFVHDQDQGVAEFLLEEDPVHQMDIAIPEDSTGDLTWTGFAVMNPHREPVPYIVRFLDANGNELEVREEELAPLSKRADVLSSYAPDVAQHIRGGRLRVESQRPICGLTISGHENAQLLFSPALSHRTIERSLYLPHIARPFSYWRNRLHLINQSHNAQNAELTLYSNGTEVLTDIMIAVPANGSRTVDLNEFEHLNPDSGVVRTQTTDLRAQLTFLNKENACAAFTLTNKASKSNLLLLPAYAHEAISWMGIALHNPGLEPCVAVVRGLSGAAAMVEQTIELPAKGQTSFLVSDLLGGNLQTLDRIEVLSSTKLTGITVSGKGQEQLLFVPSVASIERVFVRDITSVLNFREEGVYSMLDCGAGRIICGYKKERDNLGMSYERGFIRKLSDAFEVEWEWNAASDREEHIAYLIPLNGGGWIGVGSSQGFTSSAESKVLLLGIDESGGITWQRQLQYKTANTYIRSCLTTSKNDIAMLCYTRGQETNSPLNGLALFEISMAGELNNTSHFQKWDAENTSRSVLGLHELASGIYLLPCNVHTYNDDPVPDEDEVRLTRLDTRNQRVISDLSLSQQLHFVESRLLEDGNIEICGWLTDDQTGRAAYSIFQYSAFGEMLNSQAMPFEVNPVSVAGIRTCPDGSRWWVYRHDALFGVPYSTSRVCDLISKDGAFLGSNWLTLTNFRDDSNGEYWFYATIDGGMEFLKRMGDRAILLNVNSRGEYFKGNDEHTDD